MGPETILDPETAMGLGETGGNLAALSAFRHRAKPALLAALFAAACTSQALPAMAQTYPDRLIKMVVPFPPGGAADIPARILAQRLALVLRQTVIIDNRPGASGAVGVKSVIGAEPDGYTLLFGNASSLTILPSLLKTIDYDPVRNFAPIAKITEGYEVLVVDPAAPAKTLAELIAYAKANPGKLNYGSLGHGNLTHLAAELLKLRTGVDIVHVPYKGTAHAVTALLGGQVQMMFGDVAGLLPLAREGKVRALAVASPVRSGLAPELPTFAEAGVADFVARTFTGVVAPAGTPPAVVEKLNAAVRESLAVEATRSAINKLGSEVRPDSAAEFAIFLAQEKTKWADVVRRAGVAPE
jgi:tripartite-type tricarboxylate transporter receptor subunit TctC